MFTSVLARRLVLGAGVALLAACASGGAGGGAPSSGVSTSGRGSDRYTLTAADIADAKSNNLYDVIEKLRPDFLRQRGNTLAAGAAVGGSKGSGPPAELSSSTAVAVSGGPPPIRVYQNDQMMSGVEDLRQIPLSDVLEVKYIPGPQAGVRYGTNHASGVILVRTR